MAGGSNEEVLLRIISELVAYVSSGPFQSLPRQSGEAFQARLDGWTLNEWRQWGKQKASIASRTCRENGALKERIASLDLEITKLSTECSSTDPLTVNDPWAGASLLEENIRSLKKEQGGDAWANWKTAPKVKDANEASVEFEFMPSVGTWFGIPPRSVAMANNVGAGLTLSRRSCLMCDCDWDSTQEEYERILSPRISGSDCEEP